MSRETIRGRADQAARLIEVRCTAADPGRVAQLVLGELVWVLTRAYGYSKAQVVSALEQVLVVIAELTVEGESLAFQAPHAFRVKAASVDLPRRTLTDGVELAAWLKEAERRIRDKLADGPVVVCRDLGDYTDADRTTFLICILMPCVPPSTSTTTCWSRPAASPECTRRRP